MPEAAVIWPVPVTKQPKIWSTVHYPDGFGEDLDEIDDIDPYNHEDWEILESDLDDETRENLFG